MQISLDTAVHCTDGFCGASHYLIVRPTSWVLTNLVVKPAKLRGVANRVERLVPMSLVSKISDAGIWLECSVDEFAKLPPFTETFIKEVPASGYGSMEYDILPSLNSNQTWMYVPVTKYNIPREETIISRKIQVEAKNGHLGQLLAVIVDPGSYKITHLVFRRGHLWDRTREMVSTSVVDRVEGDTFYLKISKSEI